MNRVDVTPAHLAAAPQLLHIHARVHPRLVRDLQQLPQLRVHPLRDHDPSVTYCLQPPSPQASTPQSKKATCRLFMHPTCG